MTDCNSRDLARPSGTAQVYKCKLPTASAPPLCPSPALARTLLRATPMTTVAVQVPIAAQTLIWDPSIEYWPLYDQCGRWNVQLNRVEIYQCIRARTFPFLPLFCGPTNPPIPQTAQRLPLAFVPLSFSLPRPNLLLADLRPFPSCSPQIPTTGDSSPFGETRMPVEGNLYRPSSTAAHVVNTHTLSSSPRILPHTNYMQLREPWTCTPYVLAFHSPSASSLRHRPVRRPGFLMKDEKLDGRR